MDNCWGHRNGLFPNCSWQDKCFQIGAKYWEHWQHRLRYRAGIAWWHLVTKYYLLSWLEFWNFEICPSTSRLNCLLSLWPAALVIIEHIFSLELSHHAFMRNAQLWTQDNQTRLIKIKARNIFFPTTFVYQYRMELIAHADTWRWYFSLVMGFSTASFAESEDPCLVANQSSILTPVTSVTVPTSDLFVNRTSNFYQTIFLPNTLTEKTWRRYSFDTGLYILLEVSLHPAPPS